MASKTVQQMIDESLAPKPRIRSGKWSPSSFGNCYRQQFWNRKDETKSNPNDERSLRVFAAGQLFHDFVQGIMTKDNHCEKEVLVECDDVKGYADLVLANEVVDIKSQHSKSFWWMTKKNCDIKKEKYSNWLQVGYYASQLGKEFMRLVFVSKDDLCIQEYVQPLDDYWIAELEKELSMLRQWWLLAELPHAEPRCEQNKKGAYWQCNFCGFLDKCKQIEKEAGREHPNKNEKQETENDCL